MKLNVPTDLERLMKCLDLLKVVYAKAEMEAVTEQGGKKILVTAILVNAVFSREDGKYLFSAALPSPTQIAPNNNHGKT